MNTFLHHYTEILTDPAHLAVEVTLMLVVDVLFLGLMWPLMKRMAARVAHREHLKIDAEHGIIEHGALPQDDLTALLDAISGRPGERL